MHQALQAPEPHHDIVGEVADLCVLPVALAAVEVRGVVGFRALGMWLGPVVHACIAIIATRPLNSTICGSLGDFVAARLVHNEILSRFVAAIVERRFSMQAAGRTCGIACQKPELSRRGPWKHCSSHCQIGRASCRERV